MNYKRERAMINYAVGEIGKPFEWGTRDCNTLALNCLDILTTGRENFICITEGYYDTEKQERFEHRPQPALRVNRG